MAFMVGHFDVGDYDTWKEGFDADPAGRKQTAKGHMISRSIDNPSEVFVRVEFASTDEAKAFRDRMVATGVLDRVTVMTPPTIIEVADEVTY